jgi:hypothetical protein
MVAPAKAAVWRKFESVILPNEGDVGVVTSWNFPTDDVINLTSTRTPWNIRLFTKRDWSQKSCG